METFLAASETDTTLLAPQIFAGDTPPVVTLPGNLLQGFTLAGGTVLMRDAASGSFTPWVVGTAPPIAILCLDVSSAAGVTPIEVYVAGCFNTAWLTWPAGITPLQQASAFDGTKLVHRPLYWSTGPVTPA